jgi:hypothetical protein
VSEDELTEEMIEMAMAKADARKTCTSKGRCKVGRILRARGRESWDVWLDVRTGLVKLIPKVNA